MSCSIGAIRGCRGYQGALEAGRECRCSRSTRGRGSIRGHCGLLGAVGALGQSGDVGVPLEVAGGLGA